MSLDLTLECQTIVILISKTRKIGQSHVPFKQMGLGIVCPAVTADFILAVTDTICVKVYLGKCLLCRINGHISAANVSLMAAWLYLNRHDIRAYCEIVLVLCSSRVICFKSMDLLPYFEVHLELV